MDRMLSLAIEHVEAALDDHPEGATDELIAAFAVDQVCDSDEITDEQWQLARSSEFETAVLGLVRAALAETEGNRRLSAAPAPEYVRLWRGWAQDALNTAQARARQR